MQHAKTRTFKIPKLKRFPNNFNNHFFNDNQLHTIIILPNNQTALIIEKHSKQI